LLKLHFANKLLPKCNTSGEAIQLLKDQNDNFKSYRAHGKKILDVLEPFVHFVHRFIDAGAEAAAASVRRRVLFFRRTPADPALECRTRWQGYFCRRWRFARGARAVFDPVSY
jgi:hypothetical protein